MSEKLGPARTSARRRRGLPRPRLRVQRKDYSEETARRDRRRGPAHRHRAVRARQEDPARARASARQDRRGPARVRDARRRRHRRPARRGHHQPAAAPEVASSSGRHHRREGEGQEGRAAGRPGRAGQARAGEGVGASPGARPEPSWPSRHPDRGARLRAPWRLRGRGPQRHARLLLRRRALPRPGRSRRRTRSAWRRRGADLVDVGGESTRPGAPPVPEEEELRRVIPVLERLARARFPVPISIDTSKAAVARAALDAGAIAGQRRPGPRRPGMAPVVAAGRRARRADAHAGNAPRHAGSGPRTATWWARCARSWRAAMDRAVEAAGIREDPDLLDPGIGFAKTAEQSVEVLARLPELALPGAAAPGRAVPEELHRRPHRRASGGAPARHARRGERRRCWAGRPSSGCTTWRHPPGGPGGGGPSGIWRIRRERIDCRREASMSAKPGNGAGSERKLFGTDGVRGVANVHPMTAEVALQLGRALAWTSVRDEPPAPHRHRQGHPPVRLHARERASPRASAPWASTCCSAGRCPRRASPSSPRRCAPTPAWSSARRHNPYQDNGIKFFAATASSCPTRTELEIEGLVWVERRPPPTSTAAPTAEPSARRCASTTPSAATSSS